jgi:prepilin-type N-terminal cleavage/methylation domain-containing protein
VVKRTKKAYTLVELLIAMGIMVILIGIGIFSYLSYDRQNSVTLAAEQVKSFINKNVYQAQSSTTDLGVAVANVPAATVLEYNAGNNSFEIKKVDSEGNELSNKIYDSLQISDSVIVNSTFNNTSPEGDLPSGKKRLVFLKPDGKLDIETNQINKIELTNGGSTATVTINPNAAIITRNY